MERKKETFIFEGLGFPIKLIDTPMKKVFGQWVIDIDLYHDWVKSSLFD